MVQLKQPPSKFAVHSEETPSGLQAQEMASDHLYDSNIRMTIRRFNSRDERRRRASKPNADSQLHSDPNDDRSGDSQPKLRVVYADAALAEQQPRITDLLPIRLRTLALWFACGFVAIAAHAGLTSFYHDRLAGRQLPFDQLLNPQAPGSLSSWTASVMLIVAALLSTLIFWIRRHKIDDYRGRYRMWIYITGALIVASLDSAVDLRGTLVVAAQQTLPESTSPLFLQAGFAMIGLAIGVRLIIEMRSSRAAVTWLVAAMALHVLAGLVHWNVVSVPQIELASVATSTLALSGYWLLTMSLVVYGRYVFLEAQGLLATAEGVSVDTQAESAKQAKPATKANVESTPTKDKKRIWQLFSRSTTNGEDQLTAAKTKADTKSKPAKKAVAPSEDDEDPSTIPMPAKKPRPARKKKTTTTVAKSAPVQDSPSFAEDSDESHQHLSKSERKRLRKEKRRQRRAA